MDRKVAYCILAHEDTELVKDYIDRCLNDFIQADIDVYVFDSSSKDDTERLIKGKTEWERLYYRRFSAEYDLNDKIFRMLQGVNFEELFQYDYVWFSNSSNQFSRETLQIVREYLDEKPYDLVCLGWTKVDGKTQAEEYSTPNDFFCGCAYMTTLLGSVIMSTRTMLFDVNWEKYQKRVMVEPYKTWMLNNFYFLRILELKQFCGLFLPALPKGLKKSPYKKTTHWQKQYYSVFCGAWVKTLDDLPSVYTDKDVVCMKTGMIARFMDIPFVEHSLKNHRRRGYYSLNIYLTYRDVWERVTLAPRRQLLCTAITPRAWLIVKYKFRKSIQLHKLNRFLQRFPKIFVYGAGDYGFWVKDFFDTFHYKVDGFCVSNKKPGKEEYLGLPVYSLEELKDTAENIGFVIAMEEKNVVEVMPVLKRYVDSNHIFYEQRLFPVVQEEIGYRF